MKIFLTLMVVFVFILFIIVIWIPENVNNPIKYIFNKKECFEIKVKYDYIDEEGHTKYKIIFTNDGWASDDELMDLSDYTQSLGWISVHYTTFYGSREDATTYAEKFNNYEECIQNNKLLKIEYNRLVSLYKNQGVKPHSILYEEKQQKKEPEVKEIIIKSCK